jgi:SRSO17 transposase
MGKSYIIFGEIHARDTKAFHQMRLQLIKAAVGEEPIILCIDETGDEKKGKTTDDVAKQYIGNLGRTANGIVWS